MPSIINSDDGVVSGTSGLKTTGGNDGLLNIQSNGSTVVAVTGSGISVTGTVSQTGVSTFAAGTVSAPSITFTGDTNTGIFSPAADTIAFTEGGAEAMRIDSSGRVGIGTTGPDQTLVVKTANGGGIGIENASAKQWRWAVNSDSTFSVIESGVATRMTVDTSGNVGVNTISPNGKLEVVSTSAGANTNTLFLTNASSNASTATSLVFGVSTSPTTRNATIRAINAGSNAINLAFLTSNGDVPAERARITSGGFFKASDSGSYVGSTSNYHEFTNTTADWTLRVRNTHASDPYGVVINYSAASPNNTANVFLYCGDSAAERFSARSNGGLANYSANNVNLASDQRLKKDISPLATTWDKVKAIEVVNFRYKDCNESDPLLYGVIAQQVQPIVPELVVVTQEAKEAVEAKEAILDEEGNVVEPAVEAKEATPEYFGIREQPMYWLAIKALQEAMTRIETLEAQNAAFEARLAALEAK